MFSVRVCVYCEVHYQLQVKLKLLNCTIQWVRLSVANFSSVCVLNVGFGVNERVFSVSYFDSQKVEGFYNLMLTENECSIYSRKGTSMTEHCICVYIFFISSIIIFKFYLKWIDRKSASKRL